MARILACPGSLTLGGESAASDYAAEGTQAHDYGANVLRSHHMGEPPPPHPGDEMAAAVGVYVDFVEPLVLAAAAAGVVGIEETLESATVPGFGGTPDFYAVERSNGTCHVVDFKYGVGVPVAAERNPQLLSYAALLLERFPRLGGFWLTIVQPRCAGKGVDSWRVDPADVAAFRERVAAASTQRHFAAGDHCRWCPALATCDHLYAETKKLAALDFADATADADRWPEIMRLAAPIKRLLDAIPGRMLDAIRQGRRFEGFKAVQSLGNRTWRNDEDATLKALAKCKLGKKIVTEARLKSPTQLEREGYADQIAPLVHRPDRGLTVVAECDKRPAVEFETAAATFAELDLSFLE